MTDTEAKLREMESRIARLETLVFGPVIATQKPRSFRDHLRRAIKIAGSQTALAEKIGLSQQGISYLLNEAPQISAEVAFAIDQATKGEVPKEKLRPDIFGEAA